HPGKPKYMSLSHSKWNKVSFVERPDGADIRCNRLALGDEDVHLFASTDDKSSWFGVLGPGRGDHPRLGRTDPEPAGAGAVERTRAARCRDFPQRHHPRDRKAVLAGLNAAWPAPPLRRDAGQLLSIIAFSSEVDAGSREENASRQESRAPHEHPAPRRPQAIFRRAARP